MPRASHTPEAKRRKVDGQASSGKKRDAAIEQHQQHISEIVERHDDLVRLLFHLEKFVSLVNYDPVMAKNDKSQVFEEYRQQYDLWSKIADESNNNRAGRRSTRRQIRQQQATAGIDESGTPPPVAPEPSNNGHGHGHGNGNGNGVVGKRRESSRKSSSTPAKQSQPQQAAPSKSRSKKRKLKQESEPEEEVEEEDDFEKVPVGTEVEVSGYETIAHPSHIAPEPQFGGSLDAFLGSFVALDEFVSFEQRDQQVDDQIGIHNKITEAKEQGVMTRDASDDTEQIKKFVDPINTTDTHHRHLLGQALHFSKLMSDERKSHISLARRTAREVDLHFRREAGKEERIRKEQEQKLRQLVKKTGQDVAKKWRLAEQVVQKRLAQQIEEEKRAEGQQRLNQLLEYHDRILEPRIPLNEVEDDIEKELDASESEEQEDSDDGSDSDDSMNLSSSEDEEEAVGNADDAGLTVEELRQKYAGLENYQVEEESAELENGEDNTNNIDDDNDDKNDGDESDESIAMDSEEDEDEDEDESEGESGGDDGKEDPASLASLFGKPAAPAAASSDVPTEVEVDGKEDEKIEEVNRNGDGEDIIHAKGQTEVPFLLRGSLREYQHYGLDWLAGLYNSGTNGILADEMGLGKTIQTIALISYLACEKHIWGPHLIVVPTSVMLNWEMEFKRFAPGFKVMTYYGNPQQRKEKRRGWNKDNVWHVCITSYQLVLQDQPAFRRKKWHYMILDEAHNIKNFRSQRWQALLNFNSERRLLLTGTPLQNNLVELWSLLYFLMPSSQGTAMMPEGFANLADFQEWFAKPVDKMVEENEQMDENEDTKRTVSKLHQILRPYLLRRLKADVEKQMPLKYEHVVYCRLSKRQRYLYDDFMSRAQTRATLASGNYLSIINCLMQLRKVCNHPDLFEVRPIVTSMACTKSVVADFQIKDLLVRRRLMQSQDDMVNLQVVGLQLTGDEGLSTHEAQAGLLYNEHNTMLKELRTMRTELKESPAPKDFLTRWGHNRYMEWLSKSVKASKLAHSIYLNRFRASSKPIYGRNVMSLVSLPSSDNSRRWDVSNLKQELFTKSIAQREEQLSEVIDKYSFVTPNVVCLDRAGLELNVNEDLQQAIEPYRQNELFHQSQAKLTIAFPDKRLLQYDCGKLQRLALLMRDLIDEGHRALIFTQMTKVLDILEQFLNIHGWRYLRLDGATKIEERQVLTERFNNDPKIPVFILSTRSGGLGINLTGADTVIFYDNDWNPSMDKQCQDRCHRIGQTRDVHIYRFVSEYTIESNILRKATQKQMLDNVVIQEGDFTTDYLNKLSVKDMLDDGDDELNNASSDRVIDEKLLAQVDEDQDDAMAAKVAMKEANVDRDDFEANRANANNSSANPSAANSAAMTRVNTEAEDEGEEEEEEEEDKNDGIGHIDDYMIRFIERGDYY